MTGPLAVLLLQLALVVSAALLARHAKPAALVLGVAASLGAPWMAGPIAVVRALSVLLGFVGLLRIVDSRLLRRAPPHFDVFASGRTLLWGTLAAIESAYVLVGAAYRALGFVAPRLHVSPIASLSVGELWGKRWARPISAWLRETCFVPLARRGHRTVGLVLGFVGSAIGHAYAVLVALDLPMAALMFAFFLAQGVFVIFEARLKASRWPRAARRAWTVAIMVASSPLFVEPTLRVLGCGPPG